MKKIADLVVTLLITFIVGVIVNFVATVFVVEDGKVTQGRMLSVSGVNYLMLDIENFSERPLMGLRLSVRNTFDLASIISSEPITTGWSVDNANILLISDIPPNKKVAMLIPVLDAVEAANVNLLNSKEQGIEYVRSNSSESKLSKILQLALPPAIVYSILFTILWYLINRSIDGLKERQEQRYSEQKKEVEYLTELNEHNKSEMKSLRDEANVLRQEFNKDLAKAKVLFRKEVAIKNKFIMDSKRENDFWREIFKKITFDLRKNSDMSDMVEILLRALKIYQKYPMKNFDVEQLDSLMAYLQEISNHPSQVEFKALTNPSSS